MTDPERTLAKVEDILAYHAGVKPEQLGDLPDALERVLSHQSAAGTIARLGWNWLSEEDRIRLHDEMHKDRGVMTPPLIQPFLANLERCQTGEEVMRLMVEVVLESSRAIARAQKMATDALNVVPLRHFISDPI